MTLHYISKRPHVEEFMVLGNFSVLPTFSESETNKCHETYLFLYLMWSEVTVKQEYVVPFAQFF